MSAEQSEPTQTSTNQQKEKKVPIARLRAIAGASTLRRPAHRRGDETGFSLIELMIVLLVIAILLAVAIPTYLSARDRAENRAAQETLNNADTAAMTAYARNGAWSTGSPSLITSDENSSNIGVIATGGQTVLGTSQSRLLPPGTPLYKLIAEDHGSQWALFENATEGGWCFGELSVESASSSALTNQTGFATGAPFDRPLNLGQVPGVGTWYAALRQVDGACLLGEFLSGWRSTWSAADTDAGRDLNHVPPPGPPPNSGPGSGPSYGYRPTQ